MRPLSHCSCDRFFYWICLSIRTFPKHRFSNMQKLLEIPTPPPRQPIGSLESQVSVKESIDMLGGLVLEVRLSPEGFRLYLYRRALVTRDCTVSCSPSSPLLCTGLFLRLRFGGCQTRSPVVIHHRSTVSLILSDYSEPRPCGSVEDHIV